MEEGSGCHSLQSRLAAVVEEARERSGPFFVAEVWRTPLQTIRPLRRAAGTVLASVELDGAGFGHKSGAAIPGIGAGLAHCVQFARLALHICQAVAQVAAALGSWGGTCAVEGLTLTEVPAPLVAAVRAARAKLLEAAWGSYVAPFLEYQLLMHSVEGRAGIGAEELGYRRASMFASLAALQGVYAHLVRTSLLASSLQRSLGRQSSVDHCQCGWGYPWQEFFDAFAAGAHTSGGLPGRSSLALEQLADGNSCWSITEHALLEQDVWMLGTGAPGDGHEKLSHCAPWGVASRALCAVQATSRKSPTLARRLLTEAVWLLFLTLDCQDRSVGSQNAAALGLRSVFGSWASTRQVGNGTWPRRFWKTFDAVAARPVEAARGMQFGGRIPASVVERSARRVVRSGRASVGCSFALPRTCVRPSASGGQVEIFLDKKFFPGRRNGTLDAMRAALPFCEPHQVFRQVWLQPRTSWRSLHGRTALSRRLALAVHVSSMSWRNLGHLLMWLLPTAARLHSSGVPPSMVDIIIDNGDVAGDASASTGLEDFLRLVSSSPPVLLKSSSDEARDRWHCYRAAAWLGHTGLRQVSRRAIRTMLDLAPQMLLARRGGPRGYSMSRRWPSGASLARAPPDVYRRGSWTLLIVDRGPDTSRRLLNTAALATAAAKLVEVRRESLETLPVHQQARLVAQARILGGVRGSGLWWCGWLPRRSAVIEILPEERLTSALCEEEFFDWCARTCGHRHFCVRNVAKDGASGSAASASSMESWVDDALFRKHFESDVVADEAQFLAAVQSALEVLKTGVQP